MTPRSLVRGSLIRLPARMARAICVVLTVGIGFQSVAQGAEILTGAAAFFEADGGVSAPGFSGSLAYELFDSGGGTSALAGGAAPTLGTDFTLIFQVQMDADTRRPVPLSETAVARFSLLEV